MTENTRFVHFRLPDGLRDQFEAYCKPKGGMSLVLREMVAEIIKDHGGDVSLADEPAPRLDQVGFRLARDDAVELARLAPARGMRPNRYARAIVEAHIRRAPIYNEDEIAEIKRLAAAVRSIQQRMLGMRTRAVIAAAAELRTGLLARIWAMARNNYAYWDGDSRVPEIVTSKNQITVDGVRDKGQIIRHEHTTT